MHHNWAHAWYWWRVLRLGRQATNLFLLTPGADLYLAHPPLLSIPGFVSKGHKTGFRATLRVQFAMQLPTTTAKQIHLKSSDVKLVIIEKKMGKQDIRCRGL